MYSFDKRVHEWNLSFVVKNKEKIDFQVCFSSKNEVKLNKKFNKIVIEHHFPTNFTNKMDL